MIRTDRSSPAQLFFNGSQKQNLRSLNPNAKPFELDTLIKQRIKTRDQHSVSLKTSHLGKMCKHRTTCQAFGATQQLFSQKAKMAHLTGSKRDKVEHSFVEEED